MQITNENQDKKLKLSQNKGKEEDSEESKPDRFLRLVIQ